MFPFVKSCKVKPGRGIIFVIVLAAFVRMIIASGIPYLSRDELLYCHCAELWKTQGAEAVYALPNMTLPPFFLWFMQLLMKLTGCEAYRAGLVISFVSGLIFVFLCYKIGSKLWTPCAGLWMALLAALHPELIEFSCRVWRENFYLMFVAAAFLCFLVFIDNESCRWIYWGGFFSSLGFFIRMECIEIFICFFIALLIIYGKRKIRALLRYESIFLLGSMLGAGFVSLCCRVSPVFLLNVECGRLTYRLMRII